MIEPERKFKYDICRIFGHVPLDDGFVCDRCEYNIICKELEQRLTTQFIGRKITSQIPSQLKVAATEILNNAIREGNLTAFQNINVSTTGIVQSLGVDLCFPFEINFIHFQLTLN